MKTVNMREQMIPHSERLLWYILKALYYLGMWPDDSATPRQRKIYSAYAWALHMVSVLDVVVSSKGIITEFGNLFLLSECLSQNLVAYKGVLKIIIFNTNIKKLKNLVDDIRKSGDLITVKQDEEMTKFVKSSFYALAFLLVFFVTTSMMRGAVMRTLWTPFEPTRDKMTLFLTNVYLGLVVIPASSRYFAILWFSVCFLIYICDQLKELEERLAVLTYSEEEDQSLRLEFGEIINKHKRIVDYIARMNDSYKNILFVQNVSVSLELCLVAYMISVVGTSNVAVTLNYVWFLVIALTNAAIYCYSGNMLITSIFQSMSFQSVSFQSMSFQSMSLCDSIYACPWPGWPCDLQRDLYVVLLVSQRPLQMGALTTIMSLETYSAIVYRAYSIFTVLTNSSE